MEIFYVTGNNYKFQKAKRCADELNIDLVQKALEIKEVQSDSIEKIAKFKAQQAFNTLKKPLVVSDSGWNIPALNGFPGPYMHYINDWFNSDDFLNLMKDKEDRRIILKHVICAASEKGFKLFKGEHKGFFADKTEGKGISSDEVVKMEGSNHTIARNLNLNKETFSNCDMWEKTLSWFKNN